MQNPLRWLLVCALSLCACGGGPSNTAQAPRSSGDEEDEDETIDEEPEEGDEGAADGPLDAAAMRGLLAELELGAPVEVPGTGVTMPPPAGASPMPFAAGFLSLRERVQISVAVVEGGPDVLEALRTGGDPNAPEPAAQSPHTVSDVEGRVGRDEIRTQAGSLERQWLLAHDGTRALAVVVTYEGERARGYRRPIRRALEAVTWDRTAPLDPAAALGLEIGPVQGLELSRRSTANLMLLEPGAQFPPTPGQVVVTVSPLPARVPEDRAMGLCPQLAARFLPAEEDDVTHEGEITAGTMRGCERVARAPLPDGGYVVAYAALLFHEGTPILVTATVAESGLARWRPRFTAAAQSVRVR
ncbi:MAG: hypothetical protein KF729_03365 [Sandaracinaceae bacterium]|nr:hypothetical protein [Sandaracinaceae bacterium]